MRQLLLFSLGVLFLSSVFSQEGAPKEKIHFQAIIQGGILAGSSDHSGQLQAIHGIRYKTWSAGIGAGIDYYYERSVPLFLQLRKNIFPKPLTPFVYADGGLNFPWLKDGVAKVGGIVERTKRGPYYEAGIGYEVPIFKSSRFLFSAGYSYKELEQVVNVMPWFSVWPPPASAFETFNYSLSRIAVKTGIRF